MAWSLLESQLFTKSTKEIILVECKWKENVNHTKILKKLQKVSEYILWHNGDRQVYYGIIAKTFYNTKPAQCLLWDLNDINKLLLSS